MRGSLFQNPLKIEEVYKPKRLHSTLEYTPPTECEAGYVRLTFMG